MSTPTKELAALNKSVKYVIKNITPVMAKDMLDANINYKGMTNRVVIPNQVSLLVNEIESNNWNPTVNPITFDVDGRMVDGQHRLMAIIQTGITVTMSVLTGVNREAFKAIDGNKPRNAKSHAQILEMPNPTEMVSLFRWEENLETTGKLSSRPSACHRRSEFALQEWGYDKHKGLVDSVVWVNKYCVKGLKLPPKVLRFCHYRLSKINKQRANHYIKYLNSVSGDPQHGVFSDVKEQLIIIRENTRGHDSRYVSTHDKMVAVIFAGWKIASDPLSPKNAKLKGCPDSNDLENFIIN